MPDSAAEKVSEWISVKDRLPPKDGTGVLGYFPQRSGYVARQDVVPIHWSGWGGGTWDNSTSGHHIAEEPTHWMPIPEPPQFGDTVPDKESA